MQYFYLIQDGSKDSDTTFNGPYKSLKEAKISVEADFDFDDGYIVTILSQDDKFRLTQVAQAVYRERPALNWK